VTEFWSAIAGALVGGALTALTQLLSFRWQERRERARRREKEARDHKEHLTRQATLAFSILAKMNRGFTAITQVRDVLGAADQLVRETGMELANAARPIATDPDRFSFTLDEMILVRDIARDEWINPFMNLPHVVDGYIANMAVFRRQKAEINSMAEVGHIGPDGRAFTGIPKAKEFKYKLLLREAEVLLASMRDTIGPDYVTTNNLFHDLHAAFQDRFGSARMKVSFEVDRID